MKQSTQLQLFGLAGIAVGLAVSILCILLGPLNQDEGWYLYAARLFTEGRYPYRDFFFTQGPVMPAVYGLLAPLWSPFGILGGRICTALLGLATAFCAAGLAGRLVADKNRRFAYYGVLVLLTVNLYHGYFTAIPKTYALAGLLFTLAFLCLSYIRSSFAWAAASGLLLAAAAGTRLSLGLALPITGLYLLVTCRKNPKTWLAFGIGGGLGLVLLTSFVLKLDLEAFRFAQIFHQNRGSGGLMFALGSISRLVRGYLPAVILLIYVLCRQGARPLFASNLFLPLSVLTGIFFLQLFAPFPYDDYQVPLMPLAVVCIVVLWCVNIGGIETQASRLLIILLISLLYVGVSPMLQEWTVLRQDRFWVQIKQKTDLQLLRETAQKIKAFSGECDELLTADLYLAVETGQHVPPGMEMGPFCYFPGLSDSEADRYHVLNRAVLSNVLQKSSAKVAALSGYAFALKAPEMTPLPAAERDLILTEATTSRDLKITVPDFGQQHTTLQVYLKKKD